jgi:lysosomal Pro-X carboxypeptidase
MGQEQPYYPATGIADMFWDQGPMNWAGIEAHCKQAWGVEWARRQWAVMQWGDLDWSRVINVVFSNGLYDPWSAFGGSRAPAGRGTRALGLGAEASGAAAW